MSPEMTVSEVVARLEKRVAFHRRQAGAHAEQEAFHRKERERHSGEAEMLGRHLAAFREAAGPALDHAGNPPSFPEAGEPLDSDDDGSRPPVQRWVQAAVDGFAPGETFGLSKVIMQLGARHGFSIPRDRVSSALRRLAKLHRLQVVRRGRPHREALYIRIQAPAGS